LENLAQLQGCVRRFDALIDDCKALYSVETFAPRVHVVGPRDESHGVQALQGKDVSLTISALIHGVEVGGLGVLVEVLGLVTRGELKLQRPVGFTLGNVPAAERGVRFVERDLNRSFGRSQSSSLEEQRADELERLFSRSRRLLDLHQVKLPIDRPFWIFPYSPSGFQFAQLVAPDVTTITHWMGGFSADGQCSDEWVNSIGGSGVTIELGRNGFDPQQIALGTRVVCRAIEVARAQDVGDLIAPAGGAKASLYTWGEIIPYPPTGGPVLDPGWHNFKHVNAGDRLGVFRGRVISASHSGPVLFPKYPDPRPDGSYGEVPPAAELIRVLKEISESELP
jgi:hypothetical protein